MKQKTKRILAFAMAVVFELSTCVTSSPYTVMATEAGETIAPLAEERSGSGEVTPGTTETGTPGGSGKRGTVTPSEPSAPPAAETKYLSVKIVLGEGAGTIGGVDLENVSFTLSNGEKEVACTVNPKSSTTTGMEYATGKTYSIKEGSISDNSGMYTLGDITSTVENADSENPTLVLKIGELTPKVGTISGAASIKALSEVKYTLDGNWSDKVDRWVIEGSNAAKATVDATGVVSAKVGGQSFILAAYCNDTKLTSKEIQVTKNATKLEISTNNESAGGNSWDIPLQITVRLTDESGSPVQGREITVNVKNKLIASTELNGLTDPNGEFKPKEVKVYKIVGDIPVSASFEGDDAYLPCTEGISYKTTKDSGILSYEKKDTKTVTFTYGTEDVVKTLELRDKDKNLLETEELSDVSQVKLNVTCDNSAIQVTPKIVAPEAGSGKPLQLQLVFHANSATEKEIPFTVTAETPNYKFEKELYVKVNPYELKLEGTVSVAGSGKTEYNNKKIYDATDLVDVQATLVGDNNLTEAAKNEVNTYFTNVAYTAVNSKGKAVKVADYDAAIREEWTNKGNVSTEDNRFVYELSLSTISVDANYDFAYDYTDLAGNPINETIKQAVTLDRVKPEGTVTVEDLVNGSASETWNKFLSAITFGHFGKNSVRASMTSDDETAGVEATQYLISAKALTRSELEARTGWTGYNSKISLAASQNLVVYEKITDKAGNIQYISTDGIIVDNVAPVPVVKITPTNPGWGKGVYSATDNPGFDISVTDPVVNDAYAGLKTISYTITNGTTGYVESGTLANLERTSHLQSWTGHVTINPDNFYSNDVRVKVTADDWSTNDVASEEISIKVDNKAPIVTFSFDQSDVHNGKYYNNDKTLTITVDERNFDESYQPQVTSTAGGGYSISGWSHNGEIHTATVTFSGDSDYTVTYDCFDLAGNKSNTEKLDEFTVDKTKPVIQVSYDNNSALNNNYYKEARTATITITEHNFSPGEVTVTTTAQLDGAAASVPGVSGWSGSGDTHVATVSYSADADYTFIISATDLASNVSDPYATESFTVDQTKPTVEITNIEDRSANNGEVAPVITLNDINFDSGKTVVHLTGANKGEVDTTGMYTSTASNKGQTLTFYNFKENMDDIYTLTAETTDKAGNQYSTSKIFSVNRDGSTYLYDDYTEELIKNGYTNDPKNLVVSEINVDTLTFQELTVSENGTQKTLEPNKDFEVIESGSDVSWKEYKYTINASNFENEGDYNVSIYSEDRATNVTTNTAKSKDILFAVDKTSPVISLANIEDGGRYKVESQKFTANVDDNMALDKVEYYVDDELKQTFDADEVSANGGSLELSVDSSNAFRNVSVKAYDKANNEATTASVDVLVSANTWVQFYNNKPAFYGTIGGGVAAVVAAVAAGVHFSGAAAGTAAAAGKTAAGAGIFLAGKKRKKMKSK